MSQGLKVQRKSCSSCGQEKPIWKNHEGNRYCKSCWNKVFVKTRAIGQSYKPQRFKSKDLSLQVELLDKMVRQYLLLIENRCYTCGFLPVQKEDLQVGHFIGRSYHAVRWDLENVHLQCSRCNCEMHGNLVLYEDKLGEQLVQELKERSRGVYKLSESDLDEKIITLRKLIRQTKQDENHK